MVGLQNIFTITLLYLVVAQCTVFHMKKSINDSTKSKTRNLMGYYQSQGETELAARINVTQITKEVNHVFFAFVEVDGQRSECKLLHPYRDAIDNSDPKLRRLNEERKCDSEKQAKGNLGALFAHKIENPHQKIILSVGGASAQRSKNFTTATLTLERTKNLVKSCIRIALDYGFDGIDYDWESPTNLIEWKQYSDLITETRNQFDNLEEKDNYVVSLTVLMDVFTKETEDAFNRIKDKVNFINLMTYDSSMGSDGALHHSALYGTPEAYDTPYIDSTVQKALKYFSSNKINIGQPLYGYEVQVKLNTTTSPNAPGPGIYERVVKNNLASDTKTLIYNQIRDEYLTNKDYVRYWDDRSKASYLFNAKTNKLVTYVDERALQEVVNYIEKKDLGGMFFWHLGGSYNWKSQSEELVNFVSTKMPIDKEAKQVCASYSPYCNIMSKCVKEEFKAKNEGKVPEQRGSLLESKATSLASSKYLMVIISLVWLMV